MKVGIIANPNKDENLKTTSRLVSAVRHVGGEVLLTEESAKVLGVSAGQPSEKIFSDSDVIIALGGDGTILRLTKYAAVFGTPIFGVNLGRVGFLTEVENIDLDKSVQMLFDKAYSVEERGMLSVLSEETEYLALNEVMLGRNTQKIINTELFIDGKFFYGYYADGLIVSTPTGSTAYSLSSGGPILCPSVDAMVVSAVCPHSLYNRSIVVAGSQKIRLSVAKKSPKAVLMVDGEYKKELKPCDDVFVRSSEVKAKFIRLSEYNFFTRLVDKLNKWSMTAEEER